MQIILFMNFELPSHWAEFWLYGVETESPSCPTKERAGDASKRWQSWAEQGWIEGWTERQSLFIYKQQHFFFRIHLWPCALTHYIRFVSTFRLSSVFGPGRTVEAGRLISRFLTRVYVDLSFAALCCWPQTGSPPLRPHPTLWPNTMLTRAYFIGDQNGREEGVIRLQPTTAYAVQEFRDVKGCSGHKQPAWVWTAALVPQP